MDPDVKFGSAMMGFNKQDVMEYIEALIDKSESERESFEEQIAALNSQLDDKTRLYDALLEKNKEFQSRFEQTGSPAAEAVGEDPKVLKARLEEEEMRFNELSTEAARLRNSLEELTAENARLKQELDHSNVELSEYRLQKQNIGSVLMRAQNEADIMMTDAENKRLDIIAKTNDYIDGVRVLCDGYLTKVASEQNRLKYSADNMLSEFSKIMSAVENAKTMLDEMAPKLRSKDATPEADVK
ncbi:MAG: hypothetical protein IIZ19_08680 [Clostridia bacterium]|nr:hypothetical protein [Clostridia bacterium]